MAMTWFSGPVEGPAGAGPGASDAVPPFPLTSLAGRPLPKSWRITIGEPIQNCRALHQLYGGDVPWWSLAMCWPRPFGGG